MAMKMNIPIVGGQAVSRNIQVNNQDTVNLMAAVKGRGAKAPVVLETIPGNVFRSTVGDGPIRSSRMVASSVRGAGTDLYGVFGDKLVAMTESSGDTVVGTLNANPGRVVMARGRTSIMLVDGTDGYTYDGTTFAQIADADFPDGAAGAAPTHCVYIDGFFVVNDANTDSFFISAVEDPTDWNALDFAGAAVAPDNALALAATESLLWIIGDETAQAFYNSGNPDFPYDVVLSATQEVGILAPYSLAESEEGIFYLATTPEGGRFVYQVRGQAGQVVSRDEQEDFLNTVTDPTDAYGFIYKQAGKTFYVLQLGASTNPTRSSNCLVYNLKAGTWERRELLDGSAWRIGGHGILGNQNIGGSRLQAQSFELRLDAFQDAGQEIVRRRRTQILEQSNLELDFHSVVLDVTTATTTDPAAEPQIKMRYSDDAGQTWTDWLSEPLGRIGEYQQRVKWAKLGAGRNRLFEFECSENLNLTIIGGYAEISARRD